MNKLVSIIIPTYNTEKYVKDAIDSALSQTYKNIEVIVVDDGSTDSTRKLLEPYILNKSIKYIYQENKGLSGARNTGIKNSNGEYITLLDSDDIFLPGKIEKQVNYLKTHKECGMVYSGLRHFIDESNKVLHLKYKYYSGFIFEKLLKGNFINPNTVMMRRSVISRVGEFDESIRSSEDWDFWLKVAFNGIRICYMKRALTLYRVRKDSLSADNITMKETSLKVLNKYKNKFSNDKNISSIVLHEIIKRHIKLAIAYALNNKKDTSFEVLSPSYKHNLSLIDVLSINITKIFIFVIPVFIIKLIVKVFKKIKTLLIFERIRK